MGKYAILIVSALIFSMITYSHGLKNALLMSNTRTVQSYSQNQAHNIAQSAAMMALNNLRNDENSPFLPGVDDAFYFPSYDGFEPWPELHGSYNLNFVNQDGSLLTLQSTGQFEETKYRVNLGIMIGPSIWNPNVDQAVHAEDEIDLSNATTNAVKGDVSINNNSNSSVKLGDQQRVKITDDIFVPGGGDHVVAGRLGNLGGDVQSIQWPLNFNMPLFPEFPTISENYPFNNNTVLNPEDYDGKYINEIHVSGSNSLTINTGGEDEVHTLHVGILKLQASDIILTGEGKLIVYVESELDLNGNAKFNKDGDVNQLEVYYRGYSEVDLIDDEPIEEEDITMTGNNQIIGSLYAKNANIKLAGTAGIVGNIITGGTSVSIQGNANLSSTTEARIVYAPNAFVEISGNSELYGSVVSDRFKASGSATVTYVKDLDVNIPDLMQEGGNFEVAYWN
jgi:hypothetical protein